MYLIRVVVRLFLSENKYTPGCWLTLKSSIRNVNSCEIYVIGCRESIGVWTNSVLPQMVVEMNKHLAKINKKVTWRFSQPRWLNSLSNHGDMDYRPCLLQCKAESSNSVNAVSCCALSCDLQRMECCLLYWHWLIIGHTSPLFEPDNANQIRESTLMYLRPS